MENMIIITSNVNNLKKSYCFYKVYNSQHKIIYVNVCTIKDIAKLNNIFAKYDFEGFENLLIESKIFFDSKIAANNYMTDYLIKQGYPELNLVDNDYHKGDIICNETGQRFKTQRELCHNMNLSNSHVSNHLKGIPGHKTVKGFTYRYLKRGE